MPTYEYRCEYCGHDFEAFQKMTDEPIKECPQCRGKVKKLISAGCGLIFKGSGFYSTDYKKCSSPKENKSSACASKTCSAAKSGECPAAADKIKEPKGLKERRNS